MACSAVTSTGNSDPIYNIVPFGPMLSTAKPYSTYAVGYTSDEPLTRGQIVLVPVRNRVRPAMVLGETSPEDVKSDVNYKSIHQQTPITLNAPMVSLLESLSTYYSVSLNLTLWRLLPTSILTKLADTPPEYVASKVVPVEPITLSPAQLVISQSIKGHMDSFSTHLLHGITGSGKTEVMVDVIHEVLSLGKQVLYIVPEISLTPQLISRVSSRLGYKVSSYHSKLSASKRLHHFHHFHTGNISIILGARSALFLPVKNLGLIIVDEEHEHNYKQDNAPHYHLRDMAVLYGKLARVPVILASATPSIESYHNATLGKYQLHPLLERANTASVPEMHIVNMREADSIDGIISLELYDEIHRLIKRGEQCILFLNRRGYSPHLVCRTCGTMANCLNCSVPLTFYKSRKVFQCHYCNSTTPKLKCQTCGSNDIYDYGAGTEKVAEIVADLFPGKVMQMDTSTTSTHTKLKRAIKVFEAGEKQILVGTQMVAKGLHFPNVTLVGILHFDNMFSMPDFRANERAFQMIVQVSGRAGREGLKGRVMVQTFMPETPVIQLATAMDYHGFYQLELEHRKAFNYPPFSKICRVTVSGYHPDETMNITQQLASPIYAIGGVTVKGPAECPVHKIENTYRYNFMIVAPTHTLLLNTMHQVQELFKALRTKNITLKVDRDPYSFL